MCVAHFFPRRFFFFLGKTLRNTNGQTTGGECGDIARDREKPKYLNRKFVTKWQMLLRLLVLFSLLFCLFLFCGAHFFHFLPRRWPKKLKKVSAFLPVRYINIYILCSDPFRWPYIYVILWATFVVCFWFLFYLTARCFCHFLYYHAVYHFPRPKHTSPPTVPPAQRLPLLSLCICIFGAFLALFTQTSAGK